MKSFSTSLTVACLLATLALAVASPLEEWQLYKSKFGKQYSNALEEIERQANFILTKQQVETFNKHHAGKLGHKLELNHMADWTEEELKTQRGLRLPAEGPPTHEDNTPEAQAYLDAILNDTKPLPAEVDWRKVPGRVTAVKNQGMCGSCWAFSTTGALEGAEVKKGVKGHGLTSLSEQNLLDCSTDNSGCDGGLPTLAFDFVKREGGIDDEKSYPYAEFQHPKCMFNKSHVAMTDSGYAQIKVGDEEQLKHVVAKFGPVSVGIDASSFAFQSYSSGVYNNPDCSSDQLDHGVLVVGYGTDKKYGDYWIVKNSWGAQWGEKGYLKMSRNKHNQCGIATLATIPLV